MAKVIGAVVIDRECCDGCNLCVEECPRDVLALHTEVNSKGYNYAYVVNGEACIGCADCAVVCPDTCITVYRSKIS